MGDLTRDDGGELRHLAAAGVAGDDFSRFGARVYSREESLAPYNRRRAWQLSGVGSV